MLYAKTCLCLAIVVVVTLGVAAAPNNAATITWTGNWDGTHWDEAYNWDLLRVPVSTDDVIINSDDDIIQNVQNFYPINSLEVYGTLDGSVTVVETYVFHINGNFWSEDQVLYPNVA